MNVNFTGSVLPPTCDIEQILPGQVFRVLDGVYYWMMTAETYTSPEGFEYRRCVRVDTGYLGGFRSGITRVIPVDASMTVRALDDTAEIDALYPIEGSCIEIGHGE